MNTLQKYEKYFYLIFLIGIVIYFPIFFNGFVWDDLDYIINNAQIHQFNILQLLGPSIFNASPFYRPIPAIYFALVYSVSGNHALFYHILQLFLHLINTSLVLVFFASIFTEEFAFFLALIFLVHPINTESVAFIGSTTSELFFIFGMSALLFSIQKHISKIRFLLISILLLFSVLAKETGILFLFLIIIYRYLFKLGNLSKFLASGIIASLVYFVLRTLFGGVGLILTDLPIPIASLPFDQRIVNIPAMFIYYLKTFLFPLNLAVWQIWVVTSLNIPNFYFPLFLSILFFLVLFWMMAYLYKKGKYQVEATHIRTKEKQKRIKVFVDEIASFRLFVFFSLWYVLGIGILMQIVPLDMTIADRWFYFPILGLLGLIGVGLGTILQNKMSVYHRHRKLIYIWAIIILSLFSLRTFSRTFDWNNDIALFTHDLREENDNFLIDSELANDYIQMGKIDIALSYAKESVYYNPGLVNLNVLATIYNRKQEYQQAAVLLLKAIKLSKTSQYKKYAAPLIIHSLYTNYPITLLLDNRPEDSANFITNQALLKLPQEPKLYAALAIADNNLNLKQKALIAAKRAYSFSHSNSDSDLIQNIKNNQPVSIFTYNNPVNINEISAQAMFYANRGQYDKALFYYTKAHSFAPNNSRIIYDMAVTDIRLGKTTDAKNLLLEALKLANGDSNMTNQINNALHYLGQ